MSNFNYDKLKEMHSDKKLSDQVYQIYYRYLGYKDYYTELFNRTMDNWNMYLPTDTIHGFGHYPLDVVTTMIAQKRSLLTFNLAKPTADLIASGLVQAPFIPRFIPVDKPITWLTKAVEKAMFSDKETCNWNQAYFELVRAGCIIQGDITMRAVNDYHKLGNIAIENCLPNSVMYSPAWKTANTKQCPRAIQEQYLMPSEALEYYGEINDQITALLKGELAQEMEQYGPRSGAVPFQGQEGRWGSAIQFIHDYHMETKQVKKVFMLTQEGEMEIPQNLIGNPNKVMDFLDKTFGFEKWDSENIFEDVDTEKICKKSTIAPALLGLSVIEEGEPEVQVGQIPFWTWSCDRVNGEPHGIIDQVKDANRTIDYWNSLIQFKIQTEGGGGAKLIDRSKFLSADVADDATEHANDPTKIFPVKPGAMDGGQKPIQPINMSTGVPVEVYQHLDRIINQIWPLISKTTPASRGLLEGKNQSGYLYNLQKIQSDQMVYTIHFTLKQFWNQVYEGYLTQAAKQYSNEGVPRVFYFRGGKESVVLNERVDFPDGSIGIRNDMSKLKEIRHKIIIDDQQDSPSKNMADLQVLSEYQKSIVPLANLFPASISYTVGAISKKIDQFDEQDKENLEDIQAAELEKAMTDLELATLNGQIEIEKKRIELKGVLNPTAQPMQEQTENAIQMPGGQQTQPGQQTIPNQAPTQLMPQGA